MQNLILSLDKEFVSPFGITLAGLEDMISKATEETRIVYSVYDAGSQYEIRSEFPYSIAAYALATSCINTIAKLIEEEERFDAIVRCN